MENAPALATAIDNSSNFSALYIIILLCVLAATLRITLHRYLGEPKMPLLRTLSHPAWCLALVIFTPRVFEGFATGTLSFLPWEALATGGFTAAAWASCLAVLAVDLWMFLAAGQLGTMWVNRSETLTEEEKRSDRIFFIVINLLAGVLFIKQAGNFYRVAQNVNTTTEYFMIIIALLAAYFHANFSAMVVAKAPAILTTCGILGTFLGVAIGLMDFNPNDIQHSVPVLMEGIKMAFWASTCGIFFALTIKLREVFFGTRKRNKTNNARATVDDLAALMSSVRQGLAGKEDSSLLSQIKRSRQDSNDRLDALARIMEEFCKSEATQKTATR